MYVQREIDRLNLAKQINKQINKSYYKISH